MFLLLIRTSALALLISLIADAGTVTTATAERGITCRQEIRIELIRDLWSRTLQLVSKLPKDNKFSGQLRLLPKFCTKSAKVCVNTHTIGWLELREVIEVYQRSVFSNEVVQKLLPLHYNDLLHRLEYTLKHCVSTKPSKMSKKIKKMEKKIKRRRDEGALKAVTEFSFVLGWIDELAQHQIP